MGRLNPITLTSHTSEPLMTNRQKTLLEEHTKARARLERSYRSGSQRSTSILLSMCEQAWAGCYAAGVTVRPDGSVTVEPDTGDTPHKSGCATRIDHALCCSCDRA